LKDNPSFIFLLVILYHLQSRDYNSLKEEGFMYIPRLLLLSLLVSLCVATAAAQSSPSNSSDSLRPASVLPWNPLASTGPSLFQLLANAQRLSGDEGTVERGSDSVVNRPLDSGIQHILTMQQDEKTCYTLRAYRVARESPDSDSTRPAGYSTCQRATRFQLKETVDSHEIAPH
jgi:hypothetical protein